MHNSCFLKTAVLLAALLAAQSATALTVDDKSMNGADGSARFSDPDDQTPMQMMTPSHSVTSQFRDGASDGSVDPSSTRYDYDPSSGSYLPHQQ